MIQKQRIYLATNKALVCFYSTNYFTCWRIDRGNEFDELIPYFKNVKAIITFGQTAEKIEDVARNAGIKTIKRVDNVGKAVPVAYELSEPGDVFCCHQLVQAGISIKLLKKEETFL